jgi:Domain of unknown function (DUF4279)
MNAHVYTVEFRIFSATLDPVTITSELGLQPCQVRLQGTLRADGEVFTGMWAYNGYGSEDGPDWESLEEGLAFVLSKLWPVRDVLAGYRSNARLLWWCGHFQTSVDGGPQLSSSLLARLGTFGADFYIDNYLSSKDGEGQRLTLPF